MAEGNGLTEELRAERQHLLDEGNRWLRRAQELDDLDDDGDGGSRNDPGLDVALAEARDRHPPSPTVTASGCPRSPWPAARSPVTS